MKRIINIGDKKHACSDLEQYKNKHYESIDIEFANVHLIKLNDKIGRKLFTKNDLYVSSSTLWEVMQPVGQRGKHHHHGLEPSEIIDALSEINNTPLIYETYQKRYAVIVANISKYKYLNIVIELNAGLRNNRNANINKLITIFPKGNLNKKIPNINPEKIIYKK